MLVLLHDDIHDDDDDDDRYSCGCCCTGCCFLFCSVPFFFFIRCTTSFTTAPQPKEQKSRKGDQRWRVSCRAGLRCKLHVPGSEKSSSQHGVWHVRDDFSCDCHAAMGGPYTHTLYLPNGTYSSSGTHGKFSNVMVGKHVNFV